MDSHALALQFHAEVDPSRFEHWLVANANELAAVGLTPDALRRDTDVHAAAIRRAAPAMIDAWLAGLT